MAEKTYVEAKDIRFPVVVYNYDGVEECANMKQLTTVLNNWNYDGYSGDAPKIAEIRKDLVTATVVKKVVKTEKTTKVVKARS
jgi:hypothetical protein